MGLFETAYDENRHLKITPLGRSVLSGRHTVQLSSIRHDVPSKLKSRSAKREEKLLQPGRKQKPTDNLHAEDTELYEALRLLRRQIADRQHKAAYMIFSDQTLHDMVLRRPLSLEAFSGVNGVGEFKRKNYGPEFIAEIRKHTKR